MGSPAAIAEEEKKEHEEKASAKLVQQLELKCNTLAEKLYAMSVQVRYLREQASNPDDSTDVWAEATAAMDVFPSPVKSMSPVEHVGVHVGEHVLLKLPAIIGDDKGVWVKCVRLLSSGHVVKGWVEVTDSSFVNYTLHVPSLSTQA